MSFGDLVPDDYKGNVKTVYETAYGIGLGLYSTKSQSWVLGASVLSSVARRSTNVKFEAHVPNTQAAATAMSKAESMDANVFIDSVSEANTATSNNIQPPKRNGMTLSAAQSSAPPLTTQMTASEPSSGAQGRQGLSLTRIIVGDIIGALGFILSSGIAIAWVWHRQGANTNVRRHVPMESPPSTPSVELQLQDFPSVSRPHSTGLLPGDRLENAATWTEVPEMGGFGFPGVSPIVMGQSLTAGVPIMDAAEQSPPSYRGSDGSLTKREGVGIPMA